MTTYSRITYSRKRRVPIDFDEDLSVALQTEPPSIGSTTPSKSLRLPLAKRSPNSTKPCSTTSPVLPLGKTTSGRHSGKLIASQRKAALTQLTIDLGGNPHRKCKSCGMEYIHTNAEDSLLHKRFHESFLTGLEISKKTYTTMRVVWRKEGSRVLDKLAEVVEVRRGDPLAARNFAVKLLRIAEKELGAIEITEDVLWGRIRCPKQPQTHCRVEKLQKLKMQKTDSTKKTLLVTTSGQQTSPSVPTHTPILEDAIITAAPTQSLPLLKPPSVASSTNTEGSLTSGESPADDDILVTEDIAEEMDKYKIYLYFRDRRCIGLCLAEQIFEAKKAIATAVLSGHESSCIVTKAESLPARIGISRIWVSRDHRRAGVAISLLDTLCKHFCERSVHHKDDVAWSQPTETGARLARKWFGKEDGWLVYDEQAWELSTDIN